MTTKTPIPLIVAQQLPAAAQLLYTVPESDTVRITAFTLTNTQTNAQNVSIYLVPMDSMADVTTEVIASRLVAGGEPYVAYPLIGHVLAAGTQIWGSASVAAAITIYASGELIEP